MKLAMNRNGMMHSRRNFLKAVGATGAGLILGFYLPPGKRGEAAATTIKQDQHSIKPNAFIRIAPDNTVTIVVHKSEMGQGIYTTLAMLIVEELEADWDRIKIESAPAHPDYYHTKWGPFQGTGASSSVSSSWDQLRQVGAAAREMLIAAAAQKWNVPAQNCQAHRGFVLHSASGRRYSFGELSDLAATMPIPAAVALKTPSEFKLIGRPIARLDTPEKVTGVAVYGMDVRIPGMLTAVILRPPVFGARLMKLSTRAAKAVRGVYDVLPIAAGVAVVADGFWPAKKGRDALKVKWELGPHAQLSSDVLRHGYAERAKRPGLLVRKQGVPEEALAAAAKQITAVYEVPYLAHAPMEPLNCVAHITHEGCDIWTGTQMQTIDQQAACEITGFKPENVRIHTMLLGGSFGRRANPAADFVREAVHLSKALGKPVKVIWTREDEMRGGYYRPMHYSKLSAGIDANGQLIAWTHRLVGESIAKGTPFEKSLVHHGVDHLSVEGASDHLYAIANQYVDHHPVDNGVPVLWWRSVGHSFTSFAIESFLDELAALSGRDPLAFRQSLLADQPRHRAVLELAAKKSGWGQKKPTGVYQGLALHKSFGSSVAQVVDITFMDGKLRIDKVVCAVDCGMVVNPDILRAQIESGIVFGLSALYQEISIRNGQVEQQNFHNFPVLRIHETPFIDVHIVDSVEAPSGSGEIATPPILPAVCNAIFAATGKRIRRLPIPLDMLRSA